jgi:hypothetical protein
MMLIVKLSASELRKYKGGARQAIIAKARVQARKSDERKVRIERPDGSMIEQFFRGSSRLRRQSRRAR